MATHDFLQGCEEMNEHMEIYLYVVQTVLFNFLA